MWESQCLTNPWAFTACYRDSFTFYLITTIIIILYMLFFIQLITSEQTLSTLNLLYIISHFHVIPIFVIFIYKVYFMCNVYVCLWCTSLLNVAYLISVVHYLLLWSRNLNRDFKQPSFLLNCKQNWTNQQQLQFQLRSFSRGYIASQARSFCQIAITDSSRLKKQGVWVNSDDLLPISDFLKIFK
jgi:hypothetical protein